jgi:hypothetical protein
MTLRKVLSGVTAIWLLAGCGGGGSGGNPTTGSPTSGREPIAIQLAKCFRANGLPNFPDPTKDSQGNWVFPPSAGNPKTPKACESLSAQTKAGGGGSDRDRPLSAAEMAKARTYAKCMREHGVSDWPDPNSTGYFVLPPRFGVNAKRLIAPQATACKKYEPTGGARLTSGQ